MKKIFSILILFLVTTNVEAYGDINGGQAEFNYYYNTIGQLTSDKQAGYRYKYDVYGKVTMITDLSDYILHEYEYDKKGFRIQKTDYTSGTSAITCYIRDAAGNLLLTYDNSPQDGSMYNIEIPIYGASRLGTCFSGLGKTVYELNDHLGNVRATVSKTLAGVINLYEGYKDYFPFGMEMPGQRAEIENYRFGYQGQFAEKEAETGYNHFELRQYDSRIGRWMVTDPYRQYHSPYVGMGNMPVNGVDPDGGDWYYNSQTGATFWKYGSSFSVTDGFSDLIYLNAGETYSQYVDGMFFHYAQSQLIGSSPFEAYAHNFILNNNVLLGTALGNSSPFSYNFKQSLFSAS